MKMKMLLLVVGAVLIGGCADGFSVGVVTSRIPGTTISEPEQLYGFTFVLHWNLEKRKGNGTPREIDGRQQRIEDVADSSEIFFDLMKKKRLTGKSVRCIAL